MSAGKTNIDTQKRRHRGPLIGMAIAVLFGMALIAYWLFEEAATADNPQGTGPQIENQGAPAEATGTSTPPVVEPVPNN